MELFYGLIALLSLCFVDCQQSKEDEMYILIQDTRLFECRSVKNRLKINRNDVSIRDPNGRKVNYIHAPGEYAIHFHHITVTEPIPNLSGEISATLQVPLFKSSGGLRFDVPYQAIPETGLLRQRCDKESGIIKRGKKTYCRYCDLCATTEDIENELNKQGGHKYLPDVGAGREEAFAPACVQISENSYEIVRTVKLPGKKELERHVRKNFDGIEGELKRRLDRGEGKLQVSLNLISSRDPPMSLDQFHRSSNKCVCCSAQGVKNDFRCKVLQFLYCDEQQCNSNYAETCLREDAQIVACYTVEFNYRVTTDFNEVRRFLRDNNLPEQTSARPRPPPPVRRPPPSVGSNRPRPTKRPNNTSGPSQPTSSSASTGSSSSGKADQQKCLDKISPNLKDLKNYCEIFWRRAFCCPHCEGVCQDI